LSVGDALELVSPRPTLSPFGPTPRVVRVPLVGTFRTGSTEQVGEARVAIPLAAANRLFGSRGIRLSVETDGLAEALEVAPRLASVLPARARLATWRDLNRPLFFALRLEKSAMFISVFLIVPVAALALVTALTLLVAAKRGEIGMLRAMGATAGDMRRTFACLGAVIGIAGVTSGLGLGAALAVVSDRLHLVSPPGNVYFVDHLPFRLQATDVLSITAATGLMTLLATLWAARRAGAFEPVEALRA
jgi:lipoprotein-releasing system permease protein